MTVLASSGFRPAGFQSEPVNAATVTVCLPWMARCAIYRLKHFIVIRVFHSRVGVATDAGIRSVSRAGEFCFIDEQGNRPSRGIGFKEAIIGVAIEAVAVFHAGCTTGDCQGKKQCERRNQNPSSDHSVLRIHQSHQNRSALFGESFTFFAVCNGTASSGDEAPCSFKILILN